jgi:MFS superfamily sulfate permease-like transporter
MVATLAPRLIDVTAADMLEQLSAELRAQGVHLAFVEMRARLRTQMRRYAFFRVLGKDHLYNSIDAAVAAIAAYVPPDPDPKSGHETDDEDS